MEGAERGVKLALIEYFFSTYQRASKKGYTTWKR